jgi:hypothetical protein
LSSVSLTFVNIVLAIHVIAAVAAFGVMLVYPLLGSVAPIIVAPAGLAPFHRAQAQIIRRLVNPGVIVVVASGLVVAFDRGTLGTFDVRSGLAATVALGAIAEGYLAPRETLLAETAARDLRSEAGVPGKTYIALKHEVAWATRLASGIVLATIVVMVAHS